MIYDKERETFKYYSDINIPYRYYALILEPPKEASKVYSQGTTKKMVLVGLLVSLLIVFFIFSYNLTINPIITSIEDLEKFTNLPVIGAIHKIKKNQ